METINDISAVSAQNRPWNKGKLMDQSHHSSRSTSGPFGRGCSSQGAHGPRAPRGIFAASLGPDQLPAGVTRAHSMTGVASMVAEHFLF